MELKEIAGKAVLGEDITTLTKDFKPEQTVELNKLIAEGYKVEADKAKAERQQALDETVAIRKEKERVTNKANEGHNQVVSEVKLSLKKEALSDARSTFLASRQIPADKIAEIDAIAQTIDLNTVPVNSIYPRAYAQAFADTLIEAEQAQRESERNAINFNASGSGSGSSNGAGGGGEVKTYSPIVKRIMQENARRSGKVSPVPITAAEVDKAVKEGDGWRDVKTF